MPEVYHVKQLPLFVLAKICRTCKEEKLIDLFYQSKRNRDGYENQCKACKYVEQIAHNEATGNFTAYRRRWGQKHRESEKQKSSIRYYANREKRLKQISEYHKINHERRLLKRRERLAIPEVRERMRAYHVSFREKYPEIIRERNRVWRKANPLKTKQFSQHRKARKKQATTGPVKYKNILERDGYYCHICNNPILNPKDIHFDHVIPLARNGPHSEENIKVAHKVCNLRKGARLLEEMTPFQRRGIN